jgi:hypothetical protein
MRDTAVITISTSISTANTSKTTRITAMAITTTTIRIICALWLRCTAFIAFCSSRKVNVFATLMRTFPVSFFEDVLLVSVGVVFVVIHC